MNIKIRHLIFCTLLLLIPMVIGCQEDSHAANKPTFISIAFANDIVDAREMGKESRGSKYSAQSALLSGDIASRASTVNSYNPFQGIDNSRPIEDVIEESLDNSNTGEVSFYAQAKQDVYIVINLSNPDNLPIQTVTFDDILHQFYQLELGSTNKSLIIKMNVGEEHGITEHNLNAITYKTGSDVDSIDLTDAKTVKLGIVSSEMVTAIVTDVDINLHSLSLTVSLFDKDELIKNIGGYAKIVLYDGATIVAEEDLEIKSNYIIFENLKSNTIYQYAVYAYYDSLYYNGTRVHVLSKRGFATDYTLLFDASRIAFDYTSCVFDFINNSSSALNISKLELQYRGRVIKELTTNMANDLLSDTEYTIVAYYITQISTEESIMIQFKTPAKHAPIIEITNVTPLIDSISFDMIITDVDNVGFVDKIELFLNGVLFASLEDFDQLSFSELESYSSYVIVVTYVYDLNEGFDRRIMKQEYNGIFTPIE